MYRERRRMVRRSLSGGVVLAVLGALPLALFEALFVLAVRGPRLASGWEAVLFAGSVLLILAAAAAVLGMGQGLLFLGISLLTKRLAKKRLHEPRWMAIICSFVALPGIALMASKVFAGRRAQLIPGKDILALLLGLAMLAAAYGLFRLVIFFRDRFRLRRWGPPQARYLAPALLLLAAALYLADQLVLSRLYLYFHVGLTLGAAAVCQLAVGCIYVAHRPRKHWMGRLAEPGVALLVMVSAVAAGALALSVVGRSETLRFVAHEHTVVQAKVLMLTGDLGVATSPAVKATAEPKEAAPGNAPGVPGPRLADANVLLVTVDALRADHVGTYGYQRKTTPNIDRWARNAAVLTRGYCQVPHTSFSLTSLMTGSYIYSTSKQGRTRRVRTVPEVLRRYGFKTAGFFPPAVFYIDRRDFSSYENSRFGFEYVKYEFLDAGKRVDQVLAFLRQHHKRRFFIWVHFFEPHEPYVKHQGFDFGARAKDRYDSEVAYVDHHLGRLLTAVGKQHPRTIIALAADHGEEFGEHGGHYHGNALYEQQVRVPWIISVPGVAGRRINGWGQLIDMPVTILSMLDVPVPAEMRGNDLGPWIAGAGAHLLPPAFAEMEHKKMVVHRHHKLLCDLAKNFCELYDLASDPQEQRNLVSARREERARLQGLLKRWLASHSLRPSQATTRISAATLLERGQRRDPGAVPGLIALVKGTSAGAVTTAGDPREVRRQAVHTLVTMRAPLAREALEQASKDGDPGVSLPACVGAALLGHEPSLKRAETLLLRPDLPPALRRDALLALARAKKSSAAMPLGQALSQPGITVYQRIEIINALGALGDPATVPALQQQLASLRTRLWAIKALGLLRARAAVPELIRCLRKQRFISWRRAAARALGRIGDDRAKSPLRQTVLHELEPGVVTDSLAALATLQSLPLPALRTVAVPPWSCAGGTCSVELGASCADLAGRDLLLLAGQRKKSEGQAEASAEPPVITVSCGSHRVATLTASQGPGYLVPVDRAAKGKLRLQVQGQAPELRYVATRRRPVGNQEPGTKK